MKFSNSQPSKDFRLRLTIHRKLGITFSISASLLIIVGGLGYFYNAPEMIMATTTSAVAVVMVSGLFIYRSITKPIDGMKAAVIEIANRNFDIVIKEGARCDEIGELARSITQMKDDLKERDRLKEEFINVASHELRTPIQPILSFIDLAKMGIVDKEKAFVVVTEQARKLKRLADDILDASRIEGNRLILNKERYSINELVATLIEQKKPILSAGVSIRLKSAILHEAENPITYGDKSRMNQVLTNLIDNAVKFTKKGAIEINTRLVDGGDALELVVSDTGGGIPDEMFPKLFTKFATKSVGNGTEHGTGLGLFISKAIVEAHGGSIAGMNNEKGGATFTIILPVVQTGKKIDPNSEIGNDGSRQVNHTHENALQKQTANSERKKANSRVPTPEITQKA